MEFSKKTKSTVPYMTLFLQKSKAKSYKSLMKVLLSQETHALILPISEW